MILGKFVNSELIFFKRDIIMPHWLKMIKDFQILARPKLYMKK